MKKFLLILTSTLVFLCSFFCIRPQEKIVGIKIYEYNKDFDSLADKWVKAGINTAFISKELAANETFRNILQKKKISVFVIFPVFYNPVALKRDSLLYAITDKGNIAKDEWVEFVCPSRINYRKMKTDEALSIIKDLKPDGLSIDFIRQFVFWEKIYPERKAESIEKSCFCDSCLKEFSEEKKILLPENLATTVMKAEFIMNNYLESWIYYRCNLISSMVKEISDEAHSQNPDIKINVHVVPWRDVDFDGANIKVASQDLNRIAPFTDYISPMCYSPMLKRDPAWIESVVKEMNSKAPGKILTSIQVYSEYPDDSFSIEDFSRCVDASLKAPSQGIVFFSWPLFEKDMERLETLSKDLR
jgi:hypothetical protein